jgi:hypothetical protein
MKGNAHRQTSENTSSRRLVNKGKKMGRGRKKPGPEKWGSGGRWKEQEGK